MRFSAAILFIFFAHVLQAQKFADKNYYLVDSLVYENISPEYQFLIETNLKTYHAAKTDMERVTAVNQIVKLCWDENVWPKYNQWVYDYTTEKLKLNQTDTVHYQLLQALAGAIYYKGWIHYTLAEYDKCIAHYFECGEIYLQIEDFIGLANAWDNIGAIYLIKGESAKALDFHLNALEVRIKINDILGIGASHNSIGSIYYEHGNYLEALDEFEAAIFYYKKANYDAGISSALNHIGMINLLMGSLDEALNNFNKSLDVKIRLEDKQGIAMSLIQIGSISLMKKEFKTAIDYFERSLTLYSEIGDLRGVSSAKINLGVLYRLKGKHKTALNYFNEGLSIAQTIGASNEKRNALEGLVHTHILTKNFGEAERRIIEIIDMRLFDIDVNFEILPEQQKELYLNSMTPDFMNLYAIADLRKFSNPSIVETAYNNTLKLKGLLLKSSTALRDAIFNSNDSELKEKYSLWIKLKTQISQNYATGLETDSLENQANEVEQYLIKHSTHFQEQEKNNIENWKDVQQKLNTDEAAIEFIHFQSEFGNNESPLQYAALIVTSDCQFPAMIDLCKSTDLDSILGSSQPNNLKYINQIYGTKISPQIKLHDLIWKPLASTLKNVKTIYFAPTGILHKIAFGALRNENNKYLCSQYKLIQVSSTSQINKTKEFELNANSTASLFGGVKYNSDKTDQVIWNYLPGTLIEIDSINSILKNHINLNYFSKEFASEDNFKNHASNSNFIHIASHGFFYPDPSIVQKQTYSEENNDNLDFRGGSSSYGIWNFVNNKNPLMRSGIAFSGANDMWNRDIFAEGEDGVLTAQEVTTLNLRNTDLVVLSACETGLGDIRGNEGVYGLQRAFKMAGVKFLIMSLWQVPDQETSEFMILFYSKLIAQKDIRSAFSDTQKEMSQKYDPYYWAAFVLIE